jgi:hypothetical protein
MMLSVPWSGLFMSGSDLRAPVLRRSAERRVALLAASGCRGVALLDAFATGRIRLISPSLAVETLPDIADTTIEATNSALLDEVRSRAAGRKIVGLMGHLSEAKNLPIFLEIATSVRNRDIFFVLAGQFEALSVHPAVRRRLALAVSGAWENVWARTGRIPSEGQFNALFNGSDAIFAVYRDFTRSSNILAKAALFRRPILVASGYCMADRVASYRLGLAVNQNDSADCEAGIRHLLAKGTSDARYADFVEDNSLEKFRSRLAGFLSKCIEDSAQSGTI